MSLHIGRLSPDVRQPNLEHLFQKYGSCVVNLKDGYGFAVYDSNADAARALRVLHGKYVSSRRITVNWSKHQPRFSQGLRRSSRFVESSHRRTSRDGWENIRFRDALAVKNHPPSHDERHDKNSPACHDKNPPESHGESHGATSAHEKEYDKLAEGENDAGENIAEEEASLWEMNRDASGTVDASAIERERWAEAGNGTPGDGDCFDCYEPYRGLDRQKETEEMIKAGSWDSHVHGHSSEKWQEHSEKRVDVTHYDKSRSPPTCYTCGASGHIARYCPQGIDAELKARRDALDFREKMEMRQRRFGSPSRRRQEFRVHPLDQKRHRVQDGRKSLSDVKKRVPRLSDVHRESRRHGHTSEYMGQATKETHKRSRSRSRGSSLSPEPSKHTQQYNIRGSHYNQNSPDSKSSSSCSAHSSSKSSQPTQHEGLRSNINHSVPFSTSAPLHRSSPAVENKNQDGPMNSPLEDNSYLRMASEIKHTINKQEGKASALNSEVLPDNVGGVQSQNGNFDGTSSVKSNQDILMKKGRSKSLKLTTNEAILALKRYRMETREVDSADQPVEKYFGAARLWPWEIIYYRQLKKGQYQQRIMLEDLSRTKNLILWISMLGAAVVGGSTIRQTTRIHPSHLLMHFENYKYWYAVLAQVGLQAVAPQPTDTVFDEWWEKAWRAVPEQQKKGFNSLVALGAWIIWTHRNGCVFEGLAPSLSRALMVSNDERRLWEMAGARGLSSLSLSSVDSGS